MAAVFHILVDGGDDLTHGIFRDRKMLSQILLFREKWKADGALTGVMGHRIGEKTGATFQGHLFDNGCFADSGRADEKDGALVNPGDPISFGGGIGAEGAPDLIFCIFNVHIEKPHFRPGLCPGRVL